MKFEIFVTKEKGNAYAWRLRKRGRITARMPDSTDTPSKIIRTCKALYSDVAGEQYSENPAYVNSLSPLGRAIWRELTRFIALHPPRSR